MFQSRCGVCCDECKRKEEIHCKGCIHMDAPFWGGVCKVKSCCESRGLNHCGECCDFPCEMLWSMGKNQGYDPTPRIKKCKEWAQKPLENKRKLS